MMCLIYNSEPIRVGVLAEEPLRLAGLASIFEDHSSEGCPRLSPIFGKTDELLSDSSLAYLVVGLNFSTGGVKILETIHRRRPDIRLIVIGPERNDRQIMKLILAGVRAYLDLKADPQIVREAVDVVISGSIWAPRRLLSQLVDQLLEVSDSSLTSAPPHLTDRERQVLALILTARSNREIARKLGIEERTVQAHVGRLMRKTGADNRTDLFMRASNHALLKNVGILECHQGERRQRPAIEPQPVTHK
jgi:DNA-binding NarL/FixJ family response regulator